MEIRWSGGRQACLPAGLNNEWACHSATSCSRRICFTPRFRENPRRVNPPGRADRQNHPVSQACEQRIVFWLEDPQVGAKSPTPLSRTRAESRPDFAVPGESPPIRKLPQNRCNVRVGDDPTGIAKSNALCCWSAQARASMVRLEKVFVTGSYTACQ